MSTSAYITLHNLPHYSQSQFKTVTFYRHSDGYLGYNVAEMFYRLFDNPFRAKGYIEAMINADPSQVEIDSIGEMSKEVCNADYHYHLDMLTFNLTVKHIEDVEIETVFNGRVDAFINTYTEQQKAVVSRLNAHVAELRVYTREWLLGKILRNLENLKPILASKPYTKPLIDKYTKENDRFDCFLSEMNLSKEQREVRFAAQALNVTYQKALYLTKAS